MGELAAQRTDEERFSPDLSELRALGAADQIAAMLTKCEPY